MNKAWLFVVVAVGTSCPTPNVGLSIAATVETGVVEFLWSGPVNQIEVFRCGETCEGGAYNAAAPSTGALWSVVGEVVSECVTPLLVAPLTYAVAPESALVLLEPEPLASGTYAVEIWSYTACAIGGGSLGYGTTTFTVPSED